MSLCDNCNGACCRSVVIQVQDMTVDQRRWAAMRGGIDGNRWQINSPCENLRGDGRCGVYADRPAVCRQFEPGSVECMAARKREGFDDVLP